MSCVQIAYGARICPDAQTLRRQRNILTFLVILAYCEISLIIVHIYISALCTANVYAVHNGPCI